MPYVIRTRDKADGKRIRDQFRNAHWDYIAAVEDRVLLSGALYADDGTTIIGGLVVIDFDSLGAAHRFADEDPFTQAGLYATVEISPFRRGFPRALSTDYPDPRQTK